MDDSAKQWATTEAQIVATGARHSMIADGNPPMTREQLERMFLTLT
jgi:hypothetical protein